MSLLSEILSSKIRADIFRLFFGVSDNELHMREIERRSGYAIGTIQTELRKLLRLDLVNKRKDGNRTYYRANKDHPLFLDIQRLVLKTVGLVDILQNKLTKSQEITIAFVFGSIARQEEMAGSDIDLVVIGHLGLREITGLLSGLTEKVGREINPHVFSVKEFKKRIARKEHFITQVLDEPKIFIFGNENELKTMDR
jgi:predicted nucleotidyltransferase